MMNVIVHHNYLFKEQKVVLLQGLVFHIAGRSNVFLTSGQE
jgi:hypothetical protein